MLTAEQLAMVRERYRRWTSSLAPCGIPHIDPFNPCLPEQFDDTTLLECVNGWCGLRQRPELPIGGSIT
jgi:hypothetical protein